MRDRNNKKNLKVSKNCIFGVLIKGFTLTEIIIVVVLIGVLATFAVPEYGKVVRKSQERNTIMDLLSLHSGNQVYEAKKGEVLQGGGLNLAAINSGLSINLKGLDVDYVYTSTSASDYTATATGTAGNTFDLRIDQRPIDLADNNPCCETGPCPTLPETCP